MCEAVYGISNMITYTVGCTDILHVPKLEFMGTGKPVYSYFIG